MSKEGSNYVNRATFEGETYHNFRNLTYTMIDLPDGLTAYDIAPRVTRVGGTASTTLARAVSTLEGHVFFASNLIAGDVYANPVNRTSANSKIMAFSSSRTLMFYASGGNLHYYDFNKGNEKGGILKSFENEEITMLQFDIQTENNQNRDLYIGTKNSAGEGTVRKFVIGTNVDVVDYTVEDKTEWTGLSAIVKMDWRNAE